MKKNVGVSTQLQAVKTTAGPVRLDQINMKTVLVALFTT